MTRNTVAGILCGALLLALVLGAAPVRAQSGGTSQIGVVTLGVSDVYGGITEVQAKRVKGWAFRYVLKELPPNPFIPKGAVVKQPDNAEYGIRISNYATISSLLGGFSLPAPFYYERIIVEKKLAASWYVRYFDVELPRELKDGEAISLRVQSEKGPYQSVDTKVWTAPKEAPLAAHVFVTPDGLRGFVRDPAAPERTFLLKLFVAGQQQGEALKSKPMPFIGTQYQQFTFETKGLVARSGYYPWHVVAEPQGAPPRRLASETIAEGRAWFEAKPAPVEPFKLSVDQTAVKVPGKATRNPVKLKFSLNRAPLNGDIILQSIDGAWALHSLKKQYQGTWLDDKTMEATVDMVKPGVWTFTTLSKDGVPGWCSVTVERVESTFAMTVSPATVTPPRDGSRTDVTYEFTIRGGEPDREQGIHIIESPGGPCDEALNTLEPAWAKSDLRTAGYWHAGNGGTVFTLYWYVSGDTMPGTYRYRVQSKNGEDAYCTIDVVEHSRRFALRISPKAVTRPSQGEASIRYKFSVVGGTPDKEKGISIVQTPDGPCQVALNTAKRKDQEKGSWDGNDFFLNWYINVDTRAGYYMYEVEGVPTGSKDKEKVAAWLLVKDPLKSDGPPPEPPVDPVDTEGPNCVPETQGASCKEPVDTEGPNCVPETQGASCKDPVDTEGPNCVPETQGASCKEPVDTEGPNCVPETQGATCKEPVDTEGPGCVPETQGASCKEPVDTEGPGCVPETQGASCKEPVRTEGVRCPTPRTSGDLCPIRRTDGRACPMPTPIIRTQGTTCRRPIESVGTRCPIPRTTGDLCPVRRTNTDGRACPTPVPPTLIPETQGTSCRRTADTTGSRPCTRREASTY